jgi:hypothetical protein
MKEQHSSVGPTALPNPFFQKGWTVKPAFLEGTHAWVRDSTKELRKELIAYNQCFVCKSSAHLVRNCPKIDAQFHGQGVLLIQEAKL